MWLCRSDGLHTHKIYINSQILWKWQLRYWKTMQAKFKYFTIVYRIDLKLCMTANTVVNQRVFHFFKSILKLIGRIFIKSQKLWKVHIISLIDNNLWISGWCNRHLSRPSRENTENAIWGLSATENWRRFCPLESI